MEQPRNQSSSFGNRFIQKSLKKQVFSWKLPQIENLRILRGGDRVGKLCFAILFIFLSSKENEAVQLRHSDASHEAVTADPQATFKVPGHLK